MPWIGAVIGAGASLASGAMSSAGQASANTMNYGEMIQNEQWQERMSDTAVTRRVADLKMAGINPLLAVGQIGQGASTPSIQAPTMQNPNAGMAQGIASAGQVASQGYDNALKISQANAANASAEQARAVAGVQPAAAEELRQRGELEQQNAIYIGNALTQKTLADAALDGAQRQQAEDVASKVRAEITMLPTLKNWQEAQTQLANVQAMLGKLNYNQQKSIMPAIIDSAFSAAKLIGYQVPQAKNNADMQTTILGRISPYVNTVGGWIGSAVGGAARMIGGMNSAEAAYQSIGGMTGGK